MKGPKDDATKLFIWCAIGAVVALLVLGAVWIYG